MVFTVINAISIFISSTLWGFFKTTGDSRLMALNLKARLSSKNLRNFTPGQGQSPVLTKHKL